MKRFYFYIFFLLEALVINSFQLNLHASFSSELCLTTESAKPLYDTLILGKNEQAPVEILQLTTQSIAKFDLSQVVPDKKIEAKIDLRHVKEHSIPILGGILQELSQRQSLYRISLIQGSTRKFNKFFPYLRGIFKAGRCDSLIFTGNEEGKESLTGVKQKMGDLIRESGAISPPVDDKKYPGRGSISAVSPTSVAASSSSAPASSSSGTKECENFEEFVKHTESYLEYKEDQELAHKLALQEDVYRDFNNVECLAVLPTGDIEKWINEINKKGAGIKAIDLSSASLEDEDVSFLLGQLSLFPDLSILNFSYNPITSQALESIIEILQNPSIKFINLTNTDFSTDYLDNPTDLLKILKEENKETLFFKLIWYGTSTQVITSKLPEELRHCNIEEGIIQGCIKSHLEYSRISELLNAIGVRRELRQELTRNLNK